MTDLRAFSYRYQVAVVPRGVRRARLFGVLEALFSAFTSAGSGLPPADAASGGDLFRVLIRGPKGALVREFDWTSSEDEAERQAAVVRAWLASSASEEEFLSTVREQMP
jgi:hypothetical protein